MASTDERLGRLGLQHLVRKPEDLKAALLRRKRGIQVEGQEKKEKILRGRNDLRHSETAREAGWTVSTGPSSSILNH